MPSLSSHRIGTRASKATGYASTSESYILRSLFELRKANNTESGITEHLIFWNCEWSPRIMQSLRKILVRDGRKFASIKFYDCAIQGDDINAQFFQDILRMVVENNSTASLVIKGRNLVGINASLRQHEQQSSCQSSSGHCSTSLTKTLRESLPDNTTLKALTLSGLDFCCCTSVEDLSIALSQNTTLTSISLRNSSLDDESIARLLQAITSHPNLKSLDLSKNYLGARKSNGAFSSNLALENVANLLRYKSSKLQQLNLSNQYQQHSRKSNVEEPMYYCNEMVQHHIQQHQAAVGKALSALASNECVKSIDLSNNPGCLSDISSVEILTACLAMNNTLEYANISGCGMTSEGVSYFSRKGLPKCGKALKSLVLFGSDSEDNNFCAFAAATLESGLASNTTLENLGDLPSGREFQNVQHLLNLNKAGRSALCSSPPLASWTHLLARAGNLDYDREDPISIVFTLLREGPVLMEHWNRYLTIQ